MRDRPPAEGAKDPLRPNDEDRRIARAWLETYPYPSVETLAIALMNRRLDVYAEVEALRAENERLRAAVRDYDTCVVCEAALVPHDGPMHCEDCIVEDEHYYAWQERRCSGHSSTRSQGRRRVTMNERDRKKLAKAIKTLRNPGGGVRLVSHGFDGEVRKPGECEACDGYGHIREDGTGTVDRRERKCLNCNGTGERLA